ncbi:hypothetical protein EIA31_25960, partial [Escherichia coli]|uniref:hypothetical protein n=1 Tax=Escherichia coli TaxID=562 RepID=UPI000FBB17E7
REKQKGSRGIRRGQRYRLVFQFPIRVLANEVKRRNRVLTGDSGESVEFRNLDLHRVVENNDNGNDF